MSARVLVVDDNPLNVKLLTAKLAQDYYVVSTASDGTQALASVKASPPDLILLDVMMPGLDGFEVCRRLKADPETRHIPIIMVTALSDTADRLRGLEAGVDDFLTKPVNDLALMSRVRSLLRLKMLMDEWRLREETAVQAGLMTPSEERPRPITPARALILEDDPHEQERLVAILKEGDIEGKVFTTLAEAIAAAHVEPSDLVIGSLDLAHEDGLQLCARLRANEETRALPLLMVSRPESVERLARGLDLGANDYVVRPLEPSEVLARVRIQLRQKRHYDRLREHYERNLALALVDSLTGAFNRRHWDNQLPKILARHLRDHHPLAILSIDLDHFKRVNDTYGHAVGDQVLKSVVNRLAIRLRPLDLLARLGGEEFAVALPDTDLAQAMIIAERLRQTVADPPLDIATLPKPLTLTVSLGIAAINAQQQRKDETPDALQARADAALYRAKKEGRNCVRVAE